MPLAHCALLFVSPLDLPVFIGVQTTKLVAVRIETLSRHEFAGEITFPSNGPQDMQRPKCRMHSRVCQKRGGARSGEVMKNQRAHN